MARQSRPSSVPPQNTTAEENRFQEIPSLRRTLHQTSPLFDSTNPSRYHYNITRPTFSPLPTSTTTTTTSTQPRLASLPRPNHRNQTRNVRHPDQRIIFSTVFGDEEVLRPTEREIERALLVLPFDNEQMTETQCPITLDLFQVGELVGQIRHCGHVFREHAIRNWLRRNHGCPVCRHDIRERQAPSLTASNTRMLDISLNQTPILNNMNDMDQLFDSISSRFSTIVNENMGYDVSMNMVFTFPFLYYDASFVDTSVSILDTDVD
jgi:hypothetical protein